MLQRGLIKQLWWGLAVYFATQLSHAVEDLPRVVSTNVCADIMALSLAAPQQLLSVTRKSQDPALSPMATQAKQFPSNESSAEEIIALHPDIVLASGRWQSMHQQVLLADHGIRVIAVPFPVTWDEIFFTTRMVAAHLRREQTAERLLSQLQHRLQRLQGRQRMFSVLYLRSNGGSAGANTIVDTVLAAVGVSNHATQHGQRGWGRYPLEKLL